jgi:hypothetical protein
MTASYPKTYQTNTFSKGRGEGIQHIDRRVQPFRQPVFAIFELVDLLLKHSKNASGGIAGLELGGEWVGKKVLFGASFICFQGIIENWLKAGGGGCSRVTVRHSGGSEEGGRFVGDEDRGERRGHRATRR